MQKTSQRRQTAVSIDLTAHIDAAPRFCTLRFRNEKSVEQSSARHTLTCMVPRRLRVRPLPRVLAAVTLGLWLSAWITCSVACSSGATERRSCCHHQDSPKSPSPSDRGHSSCLVHRSLATLPSVHTELFPTFSVVAQVAVDSLFADCGRDVNASLMRQSAGRDHRPPPAVCLGPALRSLAPPCPAPPRLDAAAL